MRYSKLIHWLLVVSLLCPFFYSGCDEMKSERRENATAESVQSKAASADTLEAAPEPTVPSKEEVTETQDPDEFSTSKKLSEKYGFGHWLLMPDDNIYSGLGIFVDGLMLLPYVGVTLFVLLLLIGLVVKYKMAIVTQTLLYLEGAAAFMLAIAQPLQWPGLRLWGFWVALMLSILLLIYDCVLLRKQTLTR